MEAVEDPIGVIVGLITERDPSLDRAVIVKMAEGVVGGRSKRRRVAQALLDNPGVLADGRSPAPRAVADLLIALRAAGAVDSSPPACAERGRHLRTYQRRGEDWYCAVCGPAREPRAACGHVDLALGGEVQAAGDVIIEGGQVTRLTNNSGHYRPCGDGPMSAAISAFGTQGGFVVDPAVYLEVPFP